MADRVVVSFVVPDVACPVLGPVTTLARGLQSAFDVQIVGPDFGHGICPMYRNSFPYTVVPTPRLYRFPDYWWELPRLARAVTGSVIIGVKAFPHTVGLALREKRRRGAKALVYLDEWDGALFWSRPRAERWRLAARHWYHPLEEPWHPIAERAISRADLVISTSTALQKRFGGVIVPVGVDTDFFKPAPPERVAEMKRELGLEGKWCIVFGGVVRPHKGIEIILDALVRLGRPDVRFVVVGPINEHLTKLREDPQYAPFLVALGEQPAARMPEFLSLADAFVFPLRDTLLARTQMPCKVFEAMAMGRPVIATAVSDLPEVLEGCGRIIPPDDPRALADALADLLAHPDEAEALGRAAREKCVQRYRAEVTRQQLVAAVESVL